MSPWYNSPLINLLKALFDGQRTMRQNSLLWVLAVATEQQRPLAPMLEALARDESSYHWSAKLQALVKGLNAGVPLPDALEQVPDLLPPNVVLAIRVGTETGTLAESLKQVAQEYSAEQEAANFTWQGTFLYLAALLYALMSVAGFLMYYVIPKFKKIFEDFGVELPELTQWLVKVSDEFIEILPADRAGERCHPGVARVAVPVWGVLGADAVAVVLPCPWGGSRDPANFGRGGGGRPARDRGPVHDGPASLSRQRAEPLAVRPQRSGARRRGVERVRRGRHAENVGSPHPRIRPKSGQPALGDPGSGDEHRTQHRLPHHPGSGNPAAGVPAGDGGDRRNFRHRHVLAASETDEQFILSDFCNDDETLASEDNEKAPPPQANWVARP